MKLPPIEKIPEAYTAIEDDRIILLENSAIVKASNGEKEYCIKWKDDLFYSNDNSTYWQGYPGYPILAILMLQNKLSLNREVSTYFKNINWNQRNKENKRDYKKALEEVLEDISIEEKERIYQEMDKVYEEIKNLDIQLTRKM